MMLPSGPESLTLVLSRFPEDTRWLIKEYLNQHSFLLRITKPRKLRLGSFRASGTAGIPVISMNDDLGLYSFLLVFLHELAHLLVWQKYRNKAAPHGKEWKNEYQGLVLPFIERNLFPNDLINGLNRYFHRTAASFQRDIELQRVLHDLDGKGKLFLLSDLPDKQEFELHGGKRMIKLEKIRTRYRCYCPSNKRYYLVSPAAQIIIPESLQ